MEFIVNGKSLGLVKNFVKKSGFKKFETKYFLGGQKKQFFSGFEPDHISFDYEGVWPECKKGDVWGIKADDGQTEHFFPVDLIKYSDSQLHVLGEIYPELS